MARNPDTTPVKLYWDGPSPERKALLDPERGIQWVENKAEADLVVSSSRPEGIVESESGTLTTREREILEYVADGWSNEEIADRLGITGHTVKFHLAGIYEKLGVGRRTEAIREGLKLGLLRV